MSKINKSKYENVVLYFAKYCNNQYLGRTKFNKLMYYLDFISYRDRKKTVTGDEYIHKDFGPIPDSIDKILFDLKKAGKLDIEQTSYKDGFTTKYMFLSEPDLSVFDKYEKGLLKKICSEFQRWSTDKIVSQTHLEAPWFYSKPYEKVDFRYSKDIEFFNNSSG